ncbi:Snf7 [Fragilaria crotonensis]|nr:Snf7 [Fragilaria crotonensis]
MKKLRNEVGLEPVDSVMDDIKEEMELAQEINSAIAQPIDPLMCDDDELLAELNDLGLPTEASCPDSHMPVLCRCKLHRSTLASRRDDWTDWKLNWRECKTDSGMHVFTDFPRCSRFSFRKISFLECYAIALLY